MPTTQTRRAMALRGTGLLFLLALAAAPRGGEAATVQIRAHVILASNQGTGIDERRIAESGTGTSDLSAKAALAALKNAGIKPD